MNLSIGKKITGSFLLLIIIIIGIGNISLAKLNTQANDKYYEILAEAENHPAV